MNDDVTYRQLFEKYARRDRERSVVTIVMGTLGAVGVVLAVARLRELRADRRAVTGAGA
jgi:Zn-dependent protease with chaperone function